jgi:hypothetical protein
MTWRAVSFRHWAEVALRAGETLRAAAYYAKAGAAVSFEAVCLGRGFLENKQSTDVESKYRVNEHSTSTKLGSDLGSSACSQ